MYFFVDYREKWFTELLLENNIHYDQPYINDSCSIKCANLPIGDFIISNDNEMKDIILVIERKTIMDLSSSITDGRFRQQKERIEESIKDVSKILYIIEGYSKILKNGVSKSIINSSILNLLYKHNFKILQTENHDDSYENIILLFKKFVNSDFVNKKNQSPITLISKKDKINENILATQLSIIPGVSYNTAKTISLEYSCLKNLIDKYNTLLDEQSKEKLLCDIKISESRKLGNALSKKIYKALCCNEM